MLTKKDFKQFADAISIIKDKTIRENFISEIIPMFKSNNYRFNENRFREWIERRINGESVKGLG